MAKTVSVYLDESELSFLDRLAKGESRSRSAMLGEVVRRYAQLASGENLQNHPLFRDFGDGEIAGFLVEDRKVSAKAAKAYRKRLGLD